MIKKYNGIEDAINAMPGRDRHNGLYVQVSYDIDEDAVLYDVLVDIGRGKRIEYENPRILRIGFFYSRVSPARLRELIDENVNLYNEYIASCE